MMDEMPKVARAVDNPYDYAREWKKEKRGRVVGYFCSYAPEEIIHAAGALPLRIFGSSKHISLADSHLQSYCCSLVRGGLEDALQGSLDFLDAAVFPHTCDSIQRLSDIWRLNAKIPAHLDIVLPVKLDTESAVGYFIQVYGKFRAELGKTFGITVTDEKLRESISLYNEIRELFLKLYERRSEAPGLLPGREFHELIRGSMIYDRSEFAALLKKYLDSIGSIKNIPQSMKKRIMLTGGACTHPEVYTLIEAAGGAVVWDDLCTGTRLFRGSIGGGDPVEAIAYRYLERINCPAKHKSNSSRGDDLIRETRERRIDGVVFLYLKFCDPHSFDYPYLKEYLDSKGIPSLLLEVEEQLPPEGQLMTRIETFLAML